MNFYENIVILDPNLDEKATQEAVERVKNVISKKGGDILKAENWGQRKLAYEIKKQKKGTYIVILFKAPSSAITELERLYKVFDSALKFIIIKLKKKEIKRIMTPQPGTLSVPSGQAGAPEADSAKIKPESSQAPSAVGDSTHREGEPKSV